MSTTNARRPGRGARAVASPDDRHDRTLTAPIGIIVDNPRRDLEGAVLVAAALARRGRRAVLIPLYMQGTDVPILGLEGLLLNYLRLNNEALAQSYKALGIRLFVMDTEGGVLSSDGADAPHNWGSWIASSGLGALADRYFCWGESVANAFRAAMPNGDFVVTGCPRYDLCDPSFRYYFQYPVRDFVLVNTNFSAVNPSFQRRTEDEKKAFATAGFSGPYVERLLSDVQASFTKFRLTVVKLAKALPEREFVIRPHPFESADIYRRDFEGLSTVSIRGEGSVFHAIANAACIVHLNCGTAVESALMGKVPINLAFLSTLVQDEHTPLPAQLSLNVRSEAEAIDAIITISCAKGSEGAQLVSSMLRQRDEVIRPWFHTIDGEASNRVAEGILDKLNAAPAVSRRSLKTALTGSHASPSIGQCGLGVLSALVGSQLSGMVRGRLQPERQGKDFSARDVRNILGRLAAVDPNFSGLSCAQARNPWSTLPLASVCVDMEKARG